MEELAADAKPVLTLGQVPASRPVWLLAAAILTFLIMLTIWTFPRAHEALPVMRGFLPAWAAVAFLADILTAYLLWGQALAGQDRPLVLLAISYAGTAVLIAANAWVFPAAFLNSGRHLGEGAGWMWLFWHGFFASGIALYAWRSSEAASDGRTFGRYAGRAGIAAAGVITGLIGLVYEHILPRLVAPNLQFELPFWVGPTLLSMLLVPVILLVWRLRVRSILHTWLLVAMVANLLDMALMKMGGSRYCVAWYMARGISLVAALTVLMACLSQVNQLYRTLLVSQADMRGTNAGLRVQNSELAVMATQDELTHLLNRRALLGCLAAGVARYREGGPAFGILMVDLDDFKAVNDQWGHLVGDEVLVEAASRLTHVLRTSDMIGRYGGEEFLVFLADTSEVGARAVGLKLLQAMRNEPFFFAGAARTITISIGIACVQAADTFVDQLIQRADRALYAAKHRGRNCQVGADELENARLSLK